MWLPNATGVLVAAPAGGRSTTPAGWGSAAYNTLMLGPCHRGHRRRTGQCSVPDDAGGRVLDQRVALSHRPRRKLGKLLGCGLPDGLVLTAYTRVRPDLVVEVSADLALDGLRWRHPVRFVRARDDLQAGDLASRVL
jgi:hypothetical protein